MIKTIEETKVEVMQEPTRLYGVGPITRIEQLRRLLHDRRFSSGKEAAKQVHIDRAIYIDAATRLARKAKYTKGRVHRLAHEINRSFEVSLSPSTVDELIAESYDDKGAKYNIDGWLTDLEVTKDEYIKILGTLAK